MDAQPESTARLLRVVASQQHLFEGFGAQVETVISKGPAEVSRLVHSIKRRIKAPASLEGKIKKKRAEGVLVDSVNIFNVITDICGVRVLHLFPQDIAVLKEHVDKCIAEYGWSLYEKPKAYSWDPESVAYLRDLGFDCLLKTNYYTSVHYVVKPKEDSVITCEIQIRSLLEEVWAEIDHKIKYKNRNSGVHNQEHLAVLARLVGAGSKLISVLHKR